jgi:hypothetical protein
MTCLVGRVGMGSRIAGKNLLPRRKGDPGKRHKAGQGWAAANRCRTASIEAGEADPRPADQDRRESGDSGESYQPTIFPFSMCLNSVESAARLPYSFECPYFPQGFGMALPDLGEPGTDGSCRFDGPLPLPGSSSENLAPGPCEATDREFANSRAGLLSVK